MEEFVVDERVTEGDLGEVFDTSFCPQQNVNTWSQKKTNEKKYVQL